MPYQASQRPFGVEMEFNDYYYDSSGGPRLPRGWRVHDEHCGYEAVSPILVGRTGHRSLERACRILTNRGATSFDDCGLHVHHDVSDLSKRDILRVIESWEENQNAIHALVAEHRINNGWCDDWTKAEIRSLHDQLNAYGVFSGYDRYKGLNVCAVRAHGTLEIRQHEGTCDYETIRAWVRFGQAFIHAAKKRNRKMRPARSTEVLLDRIKVTPKEKDTLYRKMGLAPKRPPSLPASDSVAMNAFPGMDQY